MRRCKQLDGRKDLVFVEKHAQNVASFQNFATSRPQVQPCVGGTDGPRPPQHLVLLVMRTTALTPLLSLPRGTQLQPRGKAQLL
jgi:hypothetical protein